MMLLYFFQKTAFSIAVDTTDLEMINLFLSNPNVDVNNIFI